MSANLIRGGLLALALAASGSAAAAGFNYNYVEGGFGEIDNGEVLFANFGYDLQKNFGLAGGLYIGDTDPGFDVNMLEFGGVFHQPIKSNLDFNASLKLLHVNVDGGPAWARGRFDDSETGLIASAGLRFQVQPKLQLEGDLKLSSNDLIDDGLGLQAAVRYYLAPKVSVAGGLAIDTELDGLFVSLRGDF